LIIQKKHTVSKQETNQGKFFRRFFLYAVFFITASGVLAAAGIYLHVSQDLPRISSLKDYRPPSVTTVYSDDNRKIAEFYRERRIIVPLSAMPKILVEAFIASEDSRFFMHRGVDYIGIARAFFKNIEAGAVVQGGSTITQQVIKPFLQSSEKTYERKLKEAILAYRIEKTFTKEEILFVYLNQIYLGHRAYGVAAAAENYFGKSLKELNLAECAMLAGLPKGPGAYSPSRYPEKAGQRQKYVLKQMVTKGYITESQAAEALNTKLDIRTPKNWYMENVPYFSEHIRQYMEETFGYDALYNGGLQIYTTVNIEMQEAAMEEVEKGLSDLNSRQKYHGKEKPQAALLCVEAKTGHVKAMAGGRSFIESQLNRAVQSKRQPGSAFKPIIYAAAIDKGYTPASILSDSPFTFWNSETRTSWSPSNYDNRFWGYIPLRKAVANSRNIPAVRVLKDIGIGYVIDYARKLGISSDLDKELSLALGASGVSLMEMVTAYSVFANTGELVHPVFVRKVLDREGNEIQEMKIENQQVIEKSTAYLMTNLLESVVKSGTARKVAVMERPVAGKTGTSSNLHDAWFIGYTTDHITGTWVGFDQERSLGKDETGSRAAAPIWLGFMSRISGVYPVREFDIPEGIVFANSECFKQGTEPTPLPEEEPSEEPVEAVAEAEPEEMPEPNVAAVQPAAGSFQPNTAAAKPVARSFHSNTAAAKSVAKKKRIQSATIIGLDQFFKSSM